MVFHFALQFCRTIVSRSSLGLSKIWATAKMENRRLTSGSLRLFDGAGINTSCLQLSDSPSVPR